MFKKLNSKLGLTFLIVLALLIVGIAYILYTSDSDEVKSARQNSEGRLVESDDGVVERAGNWTAQEAKSASSGSYLYSSGSPHDVLTLTFVGSRVEVIYTTGTNLGTLAVDVDHTVLRTIITAEQTTQYQERTVVDYLDDGLHTLRVYAQEGGVIGIDAFKVSRASQEVMIVDMRKMPNGALEAAQVQEKISVDVALQDPEPTIYRTPGQERDLELIDDVQNRVLSGIKSGSLEVVLKFESAPGFLASVDLAALLELQANPLVISITLPDEEIPLLDSSAAVIHADAVRNQYGITGQRMVIAVIDSGVDVTHPDLSDDIMLQYCANVSESNPPDRCPTTGDQAVDTTGHGTIVTGVITSNGGIIYNGHSLIGIAPDAKIVAVRTRSNFGEATSADLGSALDWIYNTGYQYGISVINISLGYGAPIAGNNCDSNSAVPTNIRTLISNIHDIRGIRIFAASGNEGNSNAITYPACLSRVIAIGATNDNDTIRPLSNGSPALDFLAPGGDITSTGATITSTGTNVCLNIISVGVCNDSGTSFASPHAASVGLLIEQTNSTAVLIDTPPNNTSPFRDVLDTSAVSIPDTRVTPSPPSYLRIDALGPVQNVLPDSTPGVAPHNDSPSTAHSLPSIGSFAYDYEYIQDPEGSDKTVNDIPLSTECGGNNFTNTVWFRYGPSVSSYLLSLTTKDSTYDTIIAVYEQTISSGNRVACNDDISYTYSTTDHGFTNEQSAVNFQVRPNFTYYTRFG